MRPSPASPPPEELLSHLSLLLVEDDVITREVLARFLSRRLASVFTAGDGVEGLRLFREKAPDLIVADINMPEMDGLNCWT